MKLFAIVNCLQIISCFVLESVGEHIAQGRASNILWPYAVSEKGLSSPAWATLHPWVETLSCWPTILAKITWDTKDEFTRVTLRLTINTSS